jgi:cell division protein FtsI (penicillin-binding protein 3)/stage V sporulation protein D (sporulation-specific penicillin-binding protein)
MDSALPEVRRDPRLRIAILAAGFVLIGAVFLWRLFYLQIIKHDYYQTAALSKQLKEYQIEPQRGIIEAYNGDRVVSLVLNEERFTLFADPTFVTKEEDVALKLAAITKADKNDMLEKLTNKNTRYAVLAKKLTKEQAKDVDNLKDRDKIKGIGVRSTSQRTYPEGNLAAQLLGFVNEEGEGQYGIEGYLNEALTGEPGLLKAITDADGVPLVANTDNVIKAPANGERVRLTLDVAMQRKMEELLKAGLDHAKAKEGGIVIMEAETGAVKAMANWPSYSPENYSQVSDVGLFNNAMVSTPMELGSIQKPLTMGAALDTNSVSANTWYSDPNTKRVGDKVISNAISYGAAERSVQEILEKSLNTGAVYLLEQMGGGEINEKGRKTLYEYLVDHYRFGKLTGIEQQGEQEGYIPSPDDGFGLNIQFANMTFGQGMNVTPLQHAAAFNAVINGGTYYRPRLVDSYIDAAGKETSVGPDVVAQSVVQSSVSDTLRNMLEATVRVNGFFTEKSGYNVGGKTGTAQIPRPEGGYYEDKYNGTYIGYVGGKTPQYIVSIRVIEPKIAGFSGSQAAAPIFTSVAQSLIDNFNVKPE